MSAPTNPANHTGTNFWLTIGPAWKLSLYRKSCINCVMQAVLRHALRSRTATADIFHAPVKIEKEPKGVFLRL